VAEVVAFGDTAIDVPASLRRTADRVERGDYGAVRFVAAVFVGEGDRLVSFAWGRVSDMEVAGAFARGSVLAGCCIEDIETAAHDESGPAA
jgi:hypothetical protein